MKNAQLEQALTSRIVIEQAKGILAERYRLDVERAFDALRAAARSNRMRLHDLAASVVTSPRTPRAVERELVRDDLNGA
jgi:AmiR/NasT family two-component response regulator